MNKLKFFLFALVMFFVGYQAQKVDLFPISGFIERFFFVEATNSQTVYKTYSYLDDKIEISCPNAKDTLVFAVFGQSNSANNGGHRFSNDNKRIINFFNGKCYIASDPMLGASGNKGSLWVSFAQKLKTEKNILLVSFGVNSSKVSQWLSKDDLGTHYSENMEGISQLGYTPDFFIWMQGEADIRTKLNEYESDLSIFLNKIKTDYPESIIALSGTSFCHGKNDKIVEIQKKISDENNFLWLGNTDKFIDDKYRFDACHLSGKGIQAVTDMFLTAVQKSLK